MGWQVSYLETNLGGHPKVDSIHLRPDGIRDGENNHADNETHDDVIHFSFFTTNRWLLGFHRFFDNFCCRTGGSTSSSGQYAIIYIVFRD